MTIKSLRRDNDGYELIANRKLNSDLFDNIFCKKSKNEIKILHNKALMNILRRFGLDIMYNSDTNFRVFYNGINNFQSNVIKK